MNELLESLPAASAVPRDPVASVEGNEVLKTVE